MNSKLVDLAVVAKMEATIYEVKTSNCLLALYTAIGQLTIHGGALKRQYPDKSIARVLVMPDVPKVDARTFKRELGISILMYTDDGSSISFSKAQHTFPRSIWHTQFKGSWCGSPTAPGGLRFLGQ